MEKQDKTADTVRPINIKIFVSQHFAGLREFIKDDEIAEFYEELIVDTVLAFSAQHRTAELEAKIKELELDLAHEIRVANGQTEINKELSQDLSDCSKELRAEIHVNDALLKQIKALKERLEAADEVINSNDDYAANNTWVTNYEKALEKYQSLKQ